MYSPLCLYEEEEEPFQMSLSDSALSHVSEQTSMSRGWTGWWDRLDILKHCMRETTWHFCAFLLLLRVRGMGGGRIKEQGRQGQTYTGGEGGAMPGRSTTTPGGLPPSPTTPPHSWTSFWSVHV